MAEDLPDRVVHPAEDVLAWVEQGSSIHLKAVTPSGDPVELTVRRGEGGRRCPPAVGGRRWRRPMADLATGGR